jgi:hypothetical protein
MKVRRSFSINIALIAGLSGFLTACHPDNPPLSGLSQPAPPAAVNKVGPLTYESTFGFFRSEATAEQQKHNENTITTFFTAKQPDGKTIENLKAEDINVTENRITVNPFTLELADRKETQQPLDIALLVDITGTMKDLIKEARNRLKEFVESPEAKKLHVRFCVSTFGDTTVKHCRRFYDIKPGQAGDAQRRDFKDELSRLEAFRGAGKDPGYPDYDENPMGALVDVANAPWGADSLRFVILMTDWGFLYSPDNQGTIGDNAPTMKAVHEAINKKGLKVYAIARTEHTFDSRKAPEKNCTVTNAATNTQHCVWHGFTTPFQELPGIVTPDRYFNFDAVLSGQTKFTSILDQIVRHVSVTYKLTYVVEKVQGLDPTLPEGQRDVQISLKDPSRGATTKTGTQSSVPTGRPQYKRSFVLSDSAIRGDNTFKATVNGQPVTANEYTVSSGEIRFKTAPAPGAKMKFEFFYDNSDLNLKLEPIVMRGGLNASNTEVHLNGIKARAGDVNFESDASGNTGVSFSKSIMAANDPYAIRRNQSLHVKIVSSANQ